jgi:hypothetical protein
MKDASSIPSTQPASSAGVLTVYPTSGPIECTLDGTATANRTWKTGQTDWISPEFGSTYQVKVYIHTSSDTAGASGGDQVFATGSGNDDEWFFDYQSGVLHFIGTNLPNGVSFTGKSVYIAGARYSGTFGVGGDTGAFTFTDNRLQTTVSNEEIIIEPSGTGFVLIDTTSGMIVPVGTTGQRPSGQTGMIRFNTNTGNLEVYNGSWRTVGEEQLIVLDEFTGDNSTTEFTLSASSTTNNVWVTLNGVLQQPGLDNTYTVSGTTLTFNEAPSSTDKIQVRNFYNGSNLSMTSIADADADTKIQVEESADEDLIRFDIAGTEIFTVTSSGIIPSTNSDGTTGYDLGASDYKWRDLYLSGSTIHLGALQLKDNGDNTFGVFQSDGVTEATMSISSEDAAKWTTPRTITLGGDLTGNVSIDGSANVTLTATVAANSVALGTDTTGAYVADVVAGTGISLSETATGAENNTVTVNIDSTVATLTGSQTLTNKTLTSPNLTTPTIGGVAVDEYIADTVGAMVTSNTENGISVTYVDADNTLDFDVADFTITLGGDLTGSATITNLGNATLTATVADDSHNHVISNVDGLQAALDLKAPLASPALTGTPTAPTAIAATNNTQVATTAYVTTAITNLIGGAPGALDTLNELAAAINDDASYASTVTTALATKVATTSAQALGSAANVLTISGSTITLARGDSTTDTISLTLGTNTNGNYVAAGATSGNGISGSVSSEGGTFTVTSNATNANTANTIVFRDASGNFSAGTITGVATSAQYADLAEIYTSDSDIEPGTVVSFGGDAEVTVSTVDGDRKIAGVISSNPGYLMNSEETGVAVALQGRVPCKVTGPISKGDMLVSAGNGMARAEDNPKIGQVIGKSLQAHDGGDGIIEVVVGRI